MKISQIETRVRHLEEKQRAEQDFARDALGKMNDKELDLFEEAARLRDCGHTEEEIAGIMGSEKWKQYQNAAEHFEEEYQ